VWALLAIGQDNPRLPGWREALADSAVGTGPFEQGLQRLRDLAAYLPDAQELIHGDLLSRNVLAHGGRVTGILDWGNSMYGDSLYDAAWLIFWWPWYPQWASLDIRQSIIDRQRARGRSADLEERLLAYEIHIALDAIAYCAFKHRWDDVATHVQSLARLTGV
jgi:hygromycin-B 4-O-kinase